MKETALRKALESSVTGCQPSVYWKNRLVRQIVKGEEMKKRTRVSFGIVLAIVLILISAVALAVTLLSPREIVEQVVVPIAQGNDTTDAPVKTYTYEELAELIRTLNENGITLDEESRIMQAFRSGHGFWEQNVVEQIFLEAFGENKSQWALEEYRFYGETMAEIGAWAVNPYLVPDEGDMTREEAAAFAVRTLEETYGIRLPMETDDQWRVSCWFMNTFDDDADAYDLTRAEWRFFYSRQPDGAVSYSIFFDRNKAWVTPHAEDYEDMLANAYSIDNVRMILQLQYGSPGNWSMEIWADFGERIRAMAPRIAVDWLWQQAGYRLPPEGSVSAEKTLDTARKASGQNNESHSTILCCTDQDRPVYRVVLAYDTAAGEESSIILWCAESDCMTGEVLEQQEYDIVPDDTVLYVPSSLQESVPDFAEDHRIAEMEQGILGVPEKIEVFTTEYGPNIAFWPPEKLAEAYPGRFSVPTQEQYDMVVQVAMDAVCEKYGPDALVNLGDYRIGMEFEFDYFSEDDWCIYATTYFSTDPEYLSDGWAVYCSIFSGEINEVEARYANEGVG